MKIRSITNSDEKDPSEKDVKIIIDRTYENSRSCDEIFEVIKERLNSKRSTNLNLLKVDI